MLKNFVFEMGTWGIIWIIICVIKAKAVQNTVVIMNLINKNNVLKALSAGKIDVLYVAYLIHS